MSRPPLPPFTAETAAEKVRLAEDGWNSRDPRKVALAYSAGSRWRNRAEFIEGRAAIEAFLTGKWRRELDYRLIKELLAFHENRIAVRFAYEWRDDSGNWFRSYGNRRRVRAMARLTPRRRSPIQVASTVSGARACPRAGMKRESGAGSAATARGMSFARHATDPMPELPPQL